jgi:hypothetical protein
LGISANRAVIVTIEPTLSTESLNIGIFRHRRVTSQRGAQNRAQFGEWQPRFVQAQRYPANIQNSFSYHWERFSTHLRNAVANASKPKV